jgi:hypothetical protein
VLKIDKFVTGLTQNLRRDLHSASRVSLVSFTNQTSEILVSEQAPSALGTASLTCDESVLSASYEQPIRRLMETKRESKLPTEIWVFTSGNIRLSDESWQWLKQRHVNLTVILYNGILEASLKPLVDYGKRWLGNDRFHLGVLTLDKPWVPARWFAVKTESPLDLEGKEATLRLSAISGKQELGSDSITVLMPRSESYWFRRYGKVMLLGALVLFALWLVFRIVRFYWPRYCVNCRRRVRPEGNQCLFCPEVTDGFLVGNLPIAGRKLKTASVSALKGKSVEIGTRRKSHLRLRRRPGERAEAFMTIVREPLGVGRWGFRADPNPHGRPVTLNGRLLESPRYLAKGDRIRIGRSEAVFVQGGRSHES